MTKRGRALGAFLWDYAVPPVCPACGEVLLHAERGESPFCPDCLSEWEREKLAPCGKCKLALPDCVCIPDALRESGVRDTVFLTAYRSGGGTVPDRLVYYGKDNNDPRVFSFLARELAIRIGRLFREAELPTDHAVITYLPRRRGGVHEHGFDQARSLARALSEETGYPLLEVLSRHGHSEEQKLLSEEERRTNLTGAFRLSSPERVRERLVLLLDDVVTTGAGLSECTRLLLGAGAERVIPVTVARTEERTRG